MWWSSYKYACSSTATQKLINFMSSIHKLRVCLLSETTTHNSQLVVSCENKALRYLNNANLCERRECFVLRSVHRREQYIITRIKIYIAALSVPLQESPSLPWILLKVNEHKSIRESDYRRWNWLKISHFNRISQTFVGIRNKQELPMNACGNWETRWDSNKQICRFNWSLEIPT